jgi:hypothetical protein
VGVASISKVAVEVMGLVTVGALSLQETKNNRIRLAGNKRKML